MYQRYPSGSASASPSSGARNRKKEGGAKGPGRGGKPNVIFFQVSDRGFPDCSRSRPVRRSVLMSPIASRPEDPPSGPDHPLGAGAPSRSPRSHLRALDTPFPLSGNTPSGSLSNLRTAPSDRRVAHCWVSSAGRCLAQTVPSRSESTTGLKVMEHTCTLRWRTDGGPRSPEGSRHL
ncbi:unnamed protein product [Boreogadus saida]